MKLNFKKISAIGTSLLLTGMTMGVATAANYPAPFTSSPTAVVYGSSAHTMDGIQAGNIQQDILDNTPSSGGATPSGGDSEQIKAQRDEFNLMDNMTDFYGGRFDEGELEELLAKGVYSNGEYEEFDYTQKIELGDGIQLTHFQDNDFNDKKPIIGFDLSDGQHILNYTLQFTPDDAEGADTSWTGIVGTYLPIMGQEYYVLAMSNTSADDHKITLLNSAVDGQLSEGETITLTTDEATYDVSVSYIESNKVKLTVSGPDGTTTTDALSATQTQKLSDGTYVGIKEVLWQNVQGGASLVEFSLGSGKLELENNQEVKINSEKLSVVKYDVVNSDETLQHNVKSYITTSGTDLDSIVIEWIIDDDTWIAPGTSLTLPGFESIQLSMTEFVTPNEEVTTIMGDTSKLTVRTTLEDGDIDLYILDLNSSSTGIEALGKDLDERLVTSGTEGDSSTPVVLNLNESESNYFVVSWVSGNNYESYAFQLDSIDEANNNQTKLKNMISGGSDLTIDQVGEYETIGNIKILLDFAEEEYTSNNNKEYATLNITALSSGNVYANRFYTAKGLQCRLPVDSAAAGDGNINLTAGGVQTAWTMNCTEQDKDGNIASGDSFTIDMGLSGTDGIEPATIGSVTVHETEDDSDVWEGYVPSDLATKLVHDKPSSGLNELEITYHGEEAYAKVFITDTGVTFTSGDGASTVLITDSEVSDSTSKHLVIVGGSCINTAAATALGVPTGTCGADFTAATGVGSGQYLIKGVDGAFTSGKLALVVAGYEKEDTANAATYLLNQNVDTSGHYIGTTSTSAESQVTTA